jgi:hypothetical protein
VDFVDDGPSTERSTRKAFSQYVVHSCIFGRLCLIVYLLSGLLLKLGHRMDFEAGWFNRLFDIKDKPLQCIGLVDGILIAFGYWGLAAIHFLP